MGYLGGYFLGVSPLTNFNPVVPPSVAYDGITIYGGNTGATIDSLWGRNEIIDDSIIENYNPVNYTPEWTTSTYILGLFENTLEAGNITGVTSPITNWLIFRQDPDETQLRFLAEVDVSQVSYEDFRALINNEYRYFVFGKSDTEISNPITSEFITPDYYGWFLINADDEISYKFDINVSTGSNATDEDYSEYSTNNRTNSFSRGNRNAKRNTVNAILRDEEQCNDLVQLNSFLDEFNTFITSTKTKYVKDRRGRIYKVFTYGETEALWNENIEEQIISVGFSYVENGDVFE